MLKKIAILFFSVFLICAIWIQTQKSVFSGFDGRITYYTESSSSNAKIVSHFASVLIFDLTGESIEIDGEVDLQNILDHFSAEVVFTESVEGGVGYYAYSDRIKYHTHMLGKTVNLHIYIKTGKTVMGAPIIFGSF